MNAFNKQVGRAGMVFFTILIIGFSFGGGVVPSDAYAYFEEACWDCGSYADSIDWSYEPSYSNYADSIDWSYEPYYPSYADSIDWSYEPSYSSYADSIDWSYDPYYSDSYYPSYADSIDWSYDPYYYNTPSYQSDYGYGGCGSNCGSSYNPPPIYVDGNCYSGCGGGRSYTPPPPVAHPPRTGCGYSSGGCGGTTHVSTPSYPTSNSNWSSYYNNIVNTNTNINTTNVSNVNTNTNTYYNIQSQNPFVPQATCAIYASPTSVGYGGATTLTWNGTNATSAYLSGFGTVAVNGSQYVSNVTGSQTYTLTVYGQNGGTNTCSTTVNVYSNPVPVAPTCSITYALSSSNYGYGYTYGSYGNSGALLSWSSSNATAAYISSVGSVSVNGSQYVYPTANTTYNMTVYGANGTTNTCSVLIPSTYTPPVTNNLNCTMYATPNSIQNGTGSVLNWTSYGAAYATLSDGIGNVALNGSVTVRPESSRVYTLTIRDYQGRTNTCFTTVNVSGSNPYVSLTSVPYTGFDGGLTENAVYWLGLMIWALAAGYVVVRYRGNIAEIFDGGLGGKAYAFAGEPTIVRERVIEKSAPMPAAEAPAPVVAQPIAAAAPIAKRSGTADRMTLQIKEGETPRLVIARN